MAHMNPPAPPQGGYSGPQISAEQFRHEHELIAVIGTMAIAVVFLLVIGALTNLLVAILVPVAFAVIGILLTTLTNKGHMVQISPNQFPHLYQMASEIAWRLNMPIPNVFVRQSPEINAYAIGVTQPGVVVMHSAVLEQFSNEEIAMIMAHEFGHIKCRHSIYLLLQQVTAGNVMGAGLIFLPLKWLFYYSSRMQEYSADRAALLGTLNIQAAVTGMIKLSVGAHLYNQMNIQAYMQQIDDFNASTGSKLVEVLGDMTHPLTVNRIQALLRFYRSPKYQQLAGLFGRSGTSTLTAGAVGTRDLFYRVAAKAEYERDVKLMAQQQAGAHPAGAAAPTISCSTCGVPLDPNARFCIRCGTPVASAGPVPAASPAPVPAANPYPAPAASSWPTPAAAPQPAPMPPEQPAPVPPEQPTGAAGAEPAAQPVPVKVVRRVAKVTPPPAPTEPPAPTTCPACHSPVQGSFCGNCGKDLRV